jgi:hypothetical protein
MNEMIKYPCINKKAWKNNITIMDNIDNNNN